MPNVRRRPMPFAQLLPLSTMLVAFACGVDLPTPPAPPANAGPSAVLFEIDGPMPSFSAAASPFAPFALSQHKLESLLDRAGKDINVQEIVVRFGAPQIGWARAMELSDALAKLATSGKPVTCHFDTADNLGYWMAVRACPRIAVAPAGSIDLVGLKLEAVFLKELLASLGITADMLHIGKYKDAAESLTNTEMSPESREAAESLLAALHDSLVAGIAAGRKKDAAAVAALIDGGPYTAQGAKAAGLVDAVETLGAQLERLADKYAGGVIDDYGKEPAKPFSLSELFDLFGEAERKAEANHPRIAIVPAIGPIVSGGGEDDMFGGMEVVSDRALAKALSEASRDASVKAIVLRIDSPGGGVVASDNLYEAVRAAAKRKPVIASMGDVAASGGYYIAAAATEIFASETTLTGSIGVVGGKLVFGEGLGKIGVRASSVERGKRASLTSPLKTFSDEERALVEGQMREAYELFIARVVEGRSLPKEKVLESAEGRVWTGAQALDRKLVDTIGPLHKAIARARELAGAGELPATLYPPPRNFMEVLGEKLSQGNSVAMTLARRTAVGRRALSLAALLQKDRVLAFAPVSLDIK